jgi:hypothetical protein
MKWILNVLGLNAANSHICCPYCKWNSSLEVDLMAKWPLDGRSLEEDIQFVIENHGLRMRLLMGF